MTESASRVSTEQPTIVTLEKAMAEAQAAARRCFRAAGFTGVSLVVNVVATSRDPDDDVTTWAAGSRVPKGRDRALLAQSLRQSAEEASGD